MRNYLFILLLVLFVFPILGDLNPIYRENESLYPNTYAKDIYMDAPWFIRNPSVLIPVQFCIHDADYVDLEELEGLYIEISTSGGLDFSETDTVFSKVYDPIIFDMDLAYWDTIVFVAVPEEFYGLDNLYLRTTIDYEDGMPWDETFTQVLRIQIGTSELPNISGWYNGDCHYHTFFTDNPYEFGGTFEMLSLCANAMGIDFVCATDHASDSCYVLGVLCDDLNEGEYNDLLDTIETYRDIGPLIIRGEEADINNVFSSSRNHYLIHGADEFFSAPIPNSVAEKSFEDVYTFLAEHDEAISYAAHPYDPEYLWVDEIIDSGMQMGVLHGLQIWNERSVWNFDVDTDEYCNPFPFSRGEMEGEDGRWDNDLLEGLLHWDMFLWRGMILWDEPIKIFISGGSDAHGDFNYFTYRTFLLGVPTLDVQATTNAFGKVRTYAFCPDVFETESVLNAIRNGNTVVTDGPFVVFHAFNRTPGSVSKTIIGATDTIDYLAFDSLSITYTNSLDFGGEIKHLTLSYVFGDTLSREDISLDHHLEGLRGNFSIPLPKPIGNGWMCVRLEARTFDEGDQYIHPDSSFRCITNPIWFNVQGEPLLADEEEIDRNLFLDITPNPFKLYCAISTLREARTEIFDNLGKKLADISNAQGRWTPAKNIRSGIYLIRTRLGKQELIRKVVLIR